MAGRKAAPISLGVLLVAGASAAEGPQPRIEALVARLDQGRALVTYNVAGALSESVVERIESGIAVRFRHRLEVLAHRHFPLTPSRELARTVVETAVRYDSLTQRYHLEREIRFGRGSETPAPIEERAVTESAVEMARWMTRVEDIPLADPSRAFPAGTLRVHVEVTLGRRWVLWMFPGTLGASADGVLEVHAP